jgi:hypothetical protein
MSIIHGSDPDDTFCNFLSVFLLYLLRLYDLMYLRFPPMPVPLYHHITLSFMNKIKKYVHARVLAPCHM